VFGPVVEVLVGEPGALACVIGGAELSIAVEFPCLTWFGILDATVDV